MMMVCLINVIVCFTSVDKGAVTCDETTRQKPANCTILQSSSRDFEVNCNKYIKWKYRLADNPLNFKNRWVNKGLCTDGLLPSP